MGEHPFLGEASNYGNVRTNRQRADTDRQHHRWGIGGADGFLETILAGDGVLGQDGFVETYFGASTSSYAHILLYLLGRDGLMRRAEGIYGYVRCAGRSIRNA